MTPTTPNTPAQHERVKARLRAAGITQSALARDLGVRRQCVNAALNGSCVTRVHAHVAALLGEPMAALFAPPRKRGRKPTTEEERADGAR